MVVTWRDGSRIMRLVSKSLEEQEVSGKMGIYCSNQWNDRVYGCERSGASTEHVVNAFHAELDPRVPSLQRARCYLDSTRNIDSETPCN
jgi:hypothetical protein